MQQRKTQRNPKEMLKSGRGKSTGRKPLADISNGGKPPEPCKKKSPPPDAGGGGDDEGSLDRLLLVRSDLSNLVNQIDELVVQALQLKMISKTGSQDIESFRKVLSDMHSSLKPWLPRLQQVIGATAVVPEEKPGPSLHTNVSTCANGQGNILSDKKCETESNLIVSPSPLVSWRKGACTVERGKQMFLLTPLPKSISSKFRGSCNPKVGVDTCQNPPQGTIRLPPLSLSKYACGDLMEKMDVKLGAADISKPCTTEVNNSTSEFCSLSPFSFTNRKSRRSSICLLTPCLKSTTAKSIANPIPESSQHDDKVILKPTQGSSGRSDDFTSEEVSPSFAPFAPRYGDILALQPAPNFLSRKENIDENLDWFLSPPKTCVLMEPSDERLFPTPANGALLASSLPMDFGSTVRKGEKAGESTLKRELWVRFDAVSASGLSFDASVFPKTERKGFLDMLEEVSCETNDTDSVVEDNVLC